MSNYVTVFALVLAYVALVAAYCALRTLARLRQATTVLAKGARGPEAHASLIEATQRNTERTEIVAEEIADLRAMVADQMKKRKDAQPGAAPGGLSHIALVRYDAFGEMSGRMSFSLALLDEHGDGVTISAIAGSADTRVYAKSISDGKGEHDLSPEEHQAVTAAIAKRRKLLPSRKTA
ncbi:MAG: hypothetical protein QOC66_1037 [Pseudonocardiales bacterium]|jgi:hypothetical protein|nr:hypothetical protein [Pseudonocardiales bacterium]